MALSKKEKNLLERLTAKANDPDDDDEIYNVYQVKGTNKLKNLLGLGSDPDDDDDDDDSDDDDDGKKSDPEPKTRSRYFGGGNK